MTLVHTLRRARDMVAGGWSEPFSRDTQGRISTPDDEGVVTICVDDALRHAAAPRVDVYWEALQQLEAVACPMATALNELALRARTGQPIEVSGAELAAITRGSVAEGTTLQGWLEQPGRKLIEVLQLFDTAALKAKAKTRESA